MVHVKFVREISIALADFGDTNDRTNDASLGTVRTTSSLKISLLHNIFIPTKWHTFAERPSQVRWPFE